MIQIRPAKREDTEFWQRIDAHISPKVLRLKMDCQQAFILETDQTRVGILRYNLFWDEIPFLTMLCLLEMHRGSGLGSSVMALWENEMRAEGHTLVMTSTQSDERAQHFYRRFGYRDAGCLLLDDARYRQPMEILMTKTL